MLLVFCDISVCVGTRKEGDSVETEVPENDTVEKLRIILRIQKEQDWLGHLQ